MHSQWNWPSTLTRAERDCEIRHARQRSQMAGQRKLRLRIHQDYHQTHGEHSYADKEHGFLSESERKVSFCESHGQRKQKYQHDPNQ
jgi:hypothetical protein